MLYPMPFRPSHLVRMPTKRYAVIEATIVPSKPRRKINEVRIFKAALQSVPTLLLATGVIASIAFLMTSAVAAYRSAASVEATHYARVTVAAGDTLWGIASRYGSDTADTPTLIGQICSVNPSISQTGALKPGAVLLVPTGAAESNIAGTAITATSHQHHRRHRVNS